MACITIPIRCPTCVQDAKHAPDCGDCRDFPTKCSISEGGLIDTVTFANNSKFTNETPLLPKSYKNARLRAFHMGRCLIEHVDHYAWQKFGDVFEQTILQAAPTPTDSSMPRQLAAAASAEISPIRQSGVRTSLWARDDVQVQGGQPAPPPGFLNVSALDTTELFTVSLTRSSASSSLVAGIPVFDRNSVNFSTWFEKVTAARKYLDEGIFLDQIRQKLGSDPTQFIKGLGSNVDTVDGLLKELQKEYDLLANPCYAHHKFSSVAQNGRDITAYHTEFATLIRAMDMGLHSSDMFIKASYIKGLDDLKMRVRLNRTNDKNPTGTTLKSLMDETSLEARVQGYSKVERDSTATAAVARVHVAHAATGTSSPPTTYTDIRTPMYLPHDPVQVYAAQSGQPRRGPAEKGWCTIHEVVTHNIQNCRSKDQTECKWCKTRFAPGGYASHVPQCTAPRCNCCGRLGHKWRHCKDNKDKQNYDRRGGQGQGQGQGQGPPPANPGRTPANPGRAPATPGRAPAPTGRAPVHARSRSPLARALPAQVALLHTPDPAQAVVVEDTPPVNIA